MLGIFEAINSLLFQISHFFTLVFLSISQIWTFFEAYGWRLLIGIAASSSFINRLLVERERRSRLARHRAIVNDTSRNIALDDRRAQNLERIEQQHMETVEVKRQRDYELRMRRVEEIERKLVGEGNRLGTSPDAQD